jgi:hypothetical protein
MKPTVSSLSPTSGPVGTKVTVKGSGLTGAVSVSVGSAANGAFNVTDDTTIAYTVPAGAVTGAVSVKTPEGVSVGGPAFTVRP